MNPRWHRLPRGYYVEHLVKLLPSIGGGQRHRHRRLAQYPAVTVGRRRNRESGGIIRSRPDQPAPPKTGECHDRTVPGFGHRKHIPFGSPMSCVVADHQAVETATGDPFGGKITLVTCQTDRTDHSISPSSIDHLGRTICRDDLLPLGLTLDIVVRQHVEIVRSELFQALGQLVPGTRRGPREELNSHPNILSTSPRLSDPLLQPVGVTTPVQVIDSTVDRVLDVVGLQRRVSSRGQPQSANTPQSRPVIKLSGREFERVPICHHPRTSRQTSPRGSRVRVSSRKWSVL